MKFCCTGTISFKQRKSLNKNNENKVKKRKEKVYSSTSTTSLSSASSSTSSIYYADMSMPRIKKYDSGFSETATTVSSIPMTESIVERLLSFERIYYENLKKHILNYSRPLRRFLSPDEIVDLFQNIEKISAISHSIVRQCEKLLDSENISNISISHIYQSWSGVMIDSYNSYLSRILKAQATLMQCQHKIAYFLQMPIELIRRDIDEFILLPIRQICLLNDVFQSETIENPPMINSIDWKIIEDIRLLARQAAVVLQSSSMSDEHDNTMSTLESSAYCPPNVTLETSQDTTVNSEITSTIVLQRVNKEPWEPKRLELLDSQLVLTRLDRTNISSTMTTNLPLANVVHIQEDNSNEELRLVVAGTSKKSSKSSSVKIMRVHLRFEHKNEYFLWFHHLANAIQQAKDQSWSKKNELVI